MWNGIFYIDDLPYIWKDKSRYPEEFYPHLLNLMEKFQLTFKVNANTYLMAELLDGKAIELPLKFPRENTLSFRYDYDFLPAGIMTRFIVSNNAGKKVSIWSMVLRMPWWSFLIVLQKNSFQFKSAAAIKGINRNSCFWSDTVLRKLTLCSVKLTSRNLFYVFAVVNVPIYLNTMFCWRQKKEAGKHLCVKNRLKMF